MAYEPKYVTLDSIPVQIPDDYSPEQKRDALEYAEAIIEVDLNDGGEFVESEITPVHEAAIKQKATCELAKGAEHPDDTSMGDLEDDGSTKSDYAAEAFCDRYEEIVEKIRAFLESETTGPYVYTTESSDEWQNWNDLQEELNIPLTDEG